MTQAAKAQVDEVLYDPAALALHQRPGVPGIRSTFGTGTELLNSLRLMFSRLACHRCPIALMLSKPEMLTGVMNAAKEIDPAGANLQPEQILKAFTDLVPVWNVMFPVEKYKFIREVIRKITIFPEEVKIRYNAEGLAQVIREAEWGRAE